MRMVTILFSLSTITVIAVVVGMITLKPEPFVIASIAFLLMAVWLMYAMRADAKEHR